MTKRTLPPTASVAQPVAGDKLHAPAAERNADAIAALLTQVGPNAGFALELASGTGQHVAHFAARLPDLSWQPTDVAPDRLASIAAYVRDAKLANLKPPLQLDATAPGWGAQHTADLIVLVNLLHLISEPEAQTLITEAASALSSRGRLVIYGPFMRGGDLTSEGDRSFHASLRASDSAIGYKDDFDTMDWMQAAGLEIADVVEMPANNLAIVARSG